jgi:hypothetical protein
VLASDTSVDNQWEQKLHLELGFEEVARKVIYRRILAAPATQSTPAASAVVQSLPVARAHAEPVVVTADEGPWWWPGKVRAALIALGIVSLYFTNIFSGNMFVGVVLPIVDVAFVIYLLMLFVGMKYRRKTDAGDRHLELYRVSNDGE